MKDYKKRAEQIYFKRINPTMNGLARGTHRVWDLTEWQMLEKQQAYLEAFGEFMNDTAKKLTH